MRILAILITLFIGSHALGQSLPDGWKRAESRYISIDHPENYQVTQYGETKIVMNGVEPLEKEGDRFKENFGVIIKEFDDKPMTLDQFAEATRKELDASPNNLNIEKVEKIETPAGPAYQIEYRMEMNGFLFYHYLRLFVSNNMGYSILYTAENQRKSYHQKLIETLFNSVKLKN